jgi:hypothetical protein
MYIKRTKDKKTYPKQQNEPAELREAMAPLTTEAKTMVRTQIYLSRAEHDFVQAEAAQRGEPMAAVIRSFIDEKMRLPEDAWVKNPMLEPTPEDPGFTLPEDAAINHDHYLYGTPKKYVKIKGRWVPAETEERTR